jgi:hypothetical protein
VLVESCACLCHFIVHVKHSGKSKVTCYCFESSWMSRDILCRTPWNISNILAANNTMWCGRHLYERIKKSVKFRKIRLSFFKLFILWGLCKNSIAKFPGPTRGRPKCRYILGSTYLQEELCVWRESKQLSSVMQALNSCPLWCNRSVIVGYDSIDQRCLLAEYTQRIRSQDCLIIWSRNQHQTLTGTAY